MNKNAATKSYVLPISGNTIANDNQFFPTTVIQFSPNDSLTLPWQKKKSLIRRLDKGAVCGGSIRNFGCQGIGKWIKAHPLTKETRLIYELKNHPSNSPLTMEQVEKDVKKAFYLWSIVSSLKFSKIRQWHSYYGKADITIEFVPRFHGIHGDGSIFVAGTSQISHAVQRDVCSDDFRVDIHMDDSRQWTSNTHNGVNLLQCLVHEIGHSLGLDHSEEPGSIMFPFFDTYQPDFKLHWEDIKAIVKLYSF